jgi:cold-inducible RNA-binding protein
VANKLFVGNLPYSTTSDSLRELFAAVGEVLTASVVTDRDSGRSKGFGFVEMATDELAQEAIKQLEGKDVDGRNLTVSEARPKVQ